MKPTVWYEMSMKRVGEILVLELDEQQPHTAKVRSYSRCPAQVLRRCYVACHITLPTPTQRLGRGGTAIKLWLEGVIHRSNASDMSNISI